MRIIELPLALCPNGELALAVLVHRTNALARGWSVWLSDNYDLAGDTPPESYTDMIGHNRFAQFGSLVADYTDDTRTIDRATGLVVQLSGTDVQLDTQSAGKGLANELLCFIGDEIMSVLSAELTGAGTYRLLVIRNRYASERTAHVEGSDVWIVRRADLQAMQHASFFGGNEIAVKVAMSFGRYDQDLAELDAVTHTIANRVLIEPAHANLRFNGSRRFLNWPGGDVTFDWTLTDAGSRFAGQDSASINTRVDFIANPPDPVFTAIEDYDLVGTQTVEDDSLALTGSELLAIVGADPFFIVVRRQITTPEFATLSNPITLYITQT